MSLNDYASAVTPGSSTYPFGNGERRITSNMADTGFNKNYHLSNSKAKLITKAELEQIAVRKYDDIIAKVNFKLLQNPEQHSWSFSYTELGITKEQLDTHIFLKIVRDANLFIKFQDDHFKIDKEDY